MRSESPSPLTDLSGSDPPVSLSNNLLARVRCVPARIPPCSTLRVTLSSVCSPSLPESPCAPQSSPLHTSVSPPDFLPWPPSPLQCFPSVSFPRCPPTSHADRSPLAAPAGALVGPHLPRSIWRLLETAGQENKFLVTRACNSHVSGLLAYKNKGPLISFFSSLLIF